jgi:hypothetical protein
VTHGQSQPPDQHGRSCSSALIPRHRTSKLVVSHSRGSRPQCGRPSWARECRLPKAVGRACPIAAIIENMPKSPTGAFFVHWFELFCLATEARDKANEIQTANPDAWPHEALSAILFSALAVEAFINELPEAAARDANGPWMTGLPGVDLLRDLAETLDMIEDSQGNIGLKYQMASKILTGRTFDSNEAPFQDFNTLVRVRNEVVHPRHRDRTREGGYIEPASPAIRDLQQRGFTTTRGRKAGDSSGGMSWLNEIECGRTANWACEAASEIITAVLTMLPQDWRLTAITLFRDRLSQM